MAIKFTNALKGKSTQSWVASILEEGGYRVIRLGVEELFREIKHLSYSQYKRLDLPPALRTLPDLLIANSDLSRAYLLEVKYRKRFDQTTFKSLYPVLVNQRRYWPQTYVWLLTSEPFVHNGTFHQDYMMVIKPEDDLEILLDDGKTRHEKWRSFHRIQRAFPQLKASKYLRKVQNAADSITKLLRELANLE